MWLDEYVNIGHSTKSATGMSVFLFEKPLCGTVHICGSAPATREFAALQCGSSVNVTHALVISGGSAYGLDCCGGVMKFLKSKNIGVLAGNFRVPICPAACIFDLKIGQNPPDPEDAFIACENAVPASKADVGLVGAGKGARCGKLPTEGESTGGGFGTHTVSYNDVHGICCGQRFRQCFRF
eukprot:GHVL01031896.1.p1 GENE.GHVL01031896.1~~GHVL01031896.1.p1  ORF type:complete len:182 (-),score=35.41 GHVL01031896.1:272-817(-)